MTDARRVEALEQSLKSLIEATEGLWRVLEVTVRTPQLRGSIGGGSVQVLASVPRLCSEAKAALRGEPGA